MKIEIGARNDPKKTKEGEEPYHTIDLPGCPYKVDEYRDVVLEGFSQANGTVSEVVAIHMVEHIIVPKLDSFFKSVYDLLTPNGVFIIHVPNFVSIVKAYVDKPEILEKLRGLLFGGANSGDRLYAKHATAWDFPLMEKYLLRAGFNVVENATCLGDRHTFGWKWLLPDASLIIVARKVPQSEG